MDGFHYSGRHLWSDDVQAEDRAALRRALLLTAVWVVVAVGAVLALDAAGLLVPLADELSRVSETNSGLAPGL